MVTSPYTERQAQTASSSHVSTEEQLLMSGIAKAVYRLNGHVLSIAETLAGPVGLTGAWWQVLASVLREPMSVADIARFIGNTRQAVQRIADRLVDEGLVEFHNNPAHARARLVAPTEKGRSAVKAIAPAHVELADRLATRYGKEKLSDLLALMEDLEVVLEDMATSTEDSHRQFDRN
jgi:DNA-binding MarR family transcriptional regulator